MGNYLIEIITRVTELIVTIFQWFFDFMNSHVILKWILLLIVSLSLINVIISLLIKKDNEEE